MNTNSIAPRPARAARDTWDDVVDNVRYLASVPGSDVVRAACPACLGAAPRDPQRTLALRRVETGGRVYVEAACSSCGQTPAALMTPALGPDAYTNRDIRPLLLDASRPMPAPPPVTPADIADEDRRTRRKVRAGIASYIAHPVDVSAVGDVAPSSSSDIAALAAAVAGLAAPRSRRAEPVAATDDGEDEDTADALLATDLPDAPESLPVLGRGGIIYRGGAHVLAGYGKSGKTSLLRTSVRDWLADGEVVLWFTEEARTMWRAKLAEYDLSGANLRIVYARGWGAARVAARIEARPEATVVIVDTVRHVLNLESENDNSEIARVCSPLLSICQSRGATSILTHHTRKNGTGGIRDVAGGGAWVDAFDQVIAVTTTDGETDPRRKITTVGRFDEGAEVHYTLRGGKLVMLGEDRSAFDLRAGILDALKDGDYHGTSAVHLAVPDTARGSKSTTERALTDLAKRGQVLRDPGIATPAPNGMPYRWKLAGGPPQQPPQHPSKGVEFDAVVPPQQVGTQVNGLDAVPLDADGCPF